MGVSSSAHATPADRARRKPRSDFASHPSLTPIEPQVKQRLPDFVPILCVPEGNVHKVKLQKFQKVHHHDNTKETDAENKTTEGTAEGSEGFGNAIARSPNDFTEGYVFQPNRTMEHMTGSETKIRFVRHFGAPGRKGKLYFLRTRAVERKNNMTERQKFLTQLLDQIKAQNNQFKTLELEQMKKIEQALEEIVDLVEKSELGDANAAELMSKQIKNVVKGQNASLITNLVNEWLGLVRKTVAPEQQTKWGRLKTNILRAKPWMPAASPSSAAKTQTELLNESRAAASADLDTLGSSVDFEDLSALRGISAGITDEDRKALHTPDTDNLSDNVLNDSLTTNLPDDGEDDAVPTPLHEEETLAFDASLLDDFFDDLVAAEPDFNKEEAVSALAVVFLHYADFLRNLYDKYAVANEESSTGASVPVVQFQIFALEVNCAIEEQEAKDIYDSMCGFDWDKAPKKPMQLNLFAHALVRVGSLYLENVMSRTSNPEFKDFDGKQVGSHLVELLRHCNDELGQNMELPEVEGIQDIRVQKLTSMAVAAVASQDGGAVAADSADSAADDATAGEVDPEANWKLNKKFVIDSVLLEDLCEEVEEADELQALLGDLLVKVKELERLIIEQFAEALGSVDTVHTSELDQVVSRADFIAHAGRIDSLIDEETSDDVFSQLCGYPFEKTQKPMDLHVYVHAWIRLANLYSMFAAADGNADFVDIVKQLDFLAEKLRSKTV